LEIPGNPKSGDFGLLEVDLNFLKRFHWFELALIIVVMGVHVYAAFSAPHNFSMRWFTRDDAYYYFKVAQNVIEGHGSTFDGINPTNGYHPLWMLLCVPIFALARFDLILPLRVLLVVMAALSTVTSILLFRLLKKPMGEPVAMLAAAYWGLDMYIHSIITQQGMETGIVALSVVALLYLMQNLDQKQELTRADLVKLALVGLFVLFSRLDGIYIVLIAGVWIVFRHTPIRYLLPVDLLLTFGLIVGAYIQRAGLKFYLLIFADSAVMMAAVTFVIQTLIFYFVGLYEHPKSQSPSQILQRTLIAIPISMALATVVMLILGILNIAQMPRAVPLIYWGGMLALTLATRFGLRIISLRAEEIQMKNEKGIWAQGKERLGTSIRWLRDGFVYFGIVGAGLLAYMGINNVLFGTFLPVSGQIKRWWGSLPNDVYGGGAKTVPDVYAIDPLHSQAWGLLTDPLYDWAGKMPSNGWTADGWYWIVVILLLAAWLFVVLRKRQRGLPRLFQTGLIALLISAELHAFIYGAMAYAAAHEWYWVMQMLSLVILAALGLRSLLDLLLWKKLIQPSSWVVSGLASILLACNFTFSIVNRMPYKDPFEGQPYMDMLPMLVGYTEPGSLIGMTGGGNAGYFITGRTVVNMDGLINSYAYFQAMRAGKGGDYLAAMGLNYVFANRYIVTETMPYVEQFKAEELIPVGAPEYGRKELLKFVPLP
jgi:hypothetical protein